MGTEALKLPGSSYPELAKIIKSYGHFDEPVNLDQVSKLIGLHPTLISRNVGFLVTTGVLEGGAKKSVTPVGKELAQALEHDIGDEIQRTWRQVVTQNDFLTKLLTAIRIRNGMDETTLESHIAYSAGQPKKNTVMTGARTVIDILRAADLVRESDGRIIVNEYEETASLGGEVVRSFPSISSGRMGRATTGKILDQPIASVRFPDQPVPQQPSGVAVNLNFEVRIDCTVGDLDSLGTKLRRVMDQLSVRGNGSEEE